MNKKSIADIKHEIMMKILIKLNESFEFKYIEYHYCPIDNNIKFKDTAWFDITIKKILKIINRYPKIGLKIINRYPKIDFIIHSSDMGAKIMFDI